MPMTITTASAAVSGQLVACNADWAGPPSCAIPICNGNVVVCVLTHCMQKRGRKLAVKIFPLACGMCPFITSNVVVCVLTHCMQKRGRKLAAKILRLACALNGFLIITIIPNFHSISIWRPVAADRDTVELLHVLSILLQVPLAEHIGVTACQISRGSIAGMISIICILIPVNFAASPSEGCMRGTYAVVCGGPCL